MQRGTYAARPIRFVTLSVDSVLQCFASLEAWNLCSTDLNFRTSLGIATSTGSAILDGESPKAHQNNRVTFFQSTGNGLNNGVQSTTGCSFRKVGRCSDSINQFRLVHSKVPLYISMS